MTAEEVITWLFLAMSVLALSVQSWALIRILNGPHRPGLTRTAACRVGASVIYVTVGINAAGQQFATLQVAFVAFAVTQATWQVNAYLDVRLNKQSGRHRR